MRGRWRYLLPSMAVMLVMGVLYAWSILKAPFAQEFSWTAGQLGANFTLTISVFSIGVFVGGRQIHRLGEKPLLMMSAALVLIGFGGCSLLSGRSIAALYLLYGCVSGFGIGVAYNVIVSATLSWFDDVRGLCSGLLMMCFGISTLLLGACASSLFQSIGWRVTFRMMGGVMAIALFALAWLLKSKPGYHPEKADTKTDVYRRPSFWLFCFYTVALAAGASMVISFSLDISLAIGASGELAAALVGVLAVCNGLGRLVCGFLSDRLPMKRVMVLAGFLAVAAACALLYAVLAHAVPAGVAGMCVTGVAYGFSPTIMSGFVAKTYGMEHFSMNFSLASFTLIPSSFSAAIGGVIVTNTGSFHATMALSLVLAAASVALGAASGSCAQREQLQEAKRERKPS